LATINYTVSGTGNCTFEAEIVWGDGAQESHTFSTSQTFQHQYLAPGVYAVAVVGQGTANDATSTCTFNPFKALFEVPAPSTPPPQLTQAAVDAAAELAKHVGPEWSQMFAEWWSRIQQSLDFGVNLNEINNYPQQVLAIANHQYQTDPEWKFRLDIVTSSLFNGQSWSSLPQGQQIEVAKSVADELHATGWLLQKARKAAKSGTQLIFQ